LAHLNVNQETQSRKTDRRTVHSSACFGLDCFALLCCVVPSPWVFHGSGGCRTAIQVCRTSFHVCCYGSPLSVTDRRTYPLNPSPLLSTPSPKQPAPTRNKQKSVKHRGPLTAPLCKFIFSFLANHPFLVKQVLFDGWVPGQAGFTFLPTWGEWRGRPGTQGVRESRVGYKNINL
jgi:hypothetical protein